MRQELAVFYDGLKRSLSVAADLMILNILLILCCVPVVTAGAAWVSCYSYLLGIIRGEEKGMPLKPFFTEFRKVFGKATVVWLLLLVCLAILYGDYYYAVYISEPANNFFLVFSIVMAVVILAAASWLFPLMARYENTIGIHLKNSCLMAVAMFPKTLLALITQIAFLLLPLFMPGLFTYIGWFWVLFGISLPMYITAKLYREPLDSKPMKNEADGQD